MTRRITQSLYESFRSTIRAIRRDVHREEPIWMGSVCGWEWGAGFFKGFGVGFNIRSDEFDLTLGPFALGGVKRGH